jgi:hypothetical protein
LARACMHCATTLAEVGYDAEPKYFLVEANGARNIAHVQRGFKNAVCFRGHDFSRLNV